jgi:hypothetical protein
MYNTIEELLNAYSRFEIEKISGTLYLIQDRAFKINEIDRKFEFEALE